MNSFFILHPYAFPKAAAVGRVIPKSRIYQHGAASAKVRELFVRQVERLVWSYKLSPDTINIPAGGGVEEIQVFTILCKGDDLDERVLRAIDKAIPSPILFMVRTGDTCRHVAAYKRASEAGGGKWVIGEYFGTTEGTEGTEGGKEAERRTLPVVSDLGALYECLLGDLIPLEGRPGETLDELLARAEGVSRIERDIARLQARVDSEKQFNRRVELNRQLKTLRKQISELTTEDTEYTEKDQGSPSVSSVCSVVKNIGVDPWTS